MLARRNGPEVGLALATERDQLLYESRVVGAAYVGCEIGAGFVPYLACRIAGLAVWVGADLGDEGHKWFHLLANRDMMQNQSHGGFKSD